MSIYEKYDRMSTGLISGLALPLIIGLGVYVFSAGNLSIPAYLTRLSDLNIMTHSISLCVFPNVLIFLAFNRFDMLRASRGVLSVTIMWAILVFGVKFFG